jgi:ribosomal protein S18 acetylase RimI-like enzyme
MPFPIRHAVDQDLEEIVRLSLLAWEPVFDSFRNIMGPAVFAVEYPDWKAAQRETVETYCAPREDRTVWVAEAEQQVVGFITCDLDQSKLIGEVVLLAVHPDFQQQGIATALNQVALDHMRASGMKVAVVGTGGDPGHAPARRAYEKAGYFGFPIVRYYQDLSAEGRSVV